MKTLKKQIALLSAVLIALLSLPLTASADYEEPLLRELRVEDVTIAEGTSGYYETYNPGTDGSDVEYFYYYYNPEFTLIFEDGTVLESEGGTLFFDDEYITPYYSDDQSCETPWQPGKHTVTACLFNAETTFEVEIIDSPVESLEIEDVEIFEGTQLSTEYVWNDKTEEYDIEYQRYDYSPVFTVTFKDGTSETCEYGLYYDGEWHSISFFDDQSIDNKWELGEHTASGSILGFKADFTVDIVEFPYVSLEILEVKPLEEGIDCYPDEDGNMIYFDPEVIFKVTDKEGDTYTISSYYDDNVYLEYDQVENPWTLGGDNRFTLHYANLYAEASVEIIEPKDYDYVEAEDGSGVFIADCRISGQENLELPSEIDGQPVIGIISLGLGDNLSDVKSITIPDSIATVIAGAFVSCENLTEFKVGSGNEYFSVENGVLFDKEKNVLAAYPRGKSGSYSVPDSVTELMYFSFTLCDKLAEVSIPNGVEAIYPFTFAGCNKLASVVIPGTVTEIGNYAFEACSLLTCVTIPKSVTTIGEEAFGYDRENYDGMIPDFKINGLAGTAAEQYALENGCKFVPLSDETLACENGVWYYVVNGEKVNATTLVKYYNTWYYVENGKVNFNATTLCNYYGTWYYVQNGEVNWNATTLCNYYGTWYYVQNGEVNWNATTLCNYYGTWYYVQNGEVNWNANTLCNYYGSWYYVQNGVLNFNATTLCKYGNTWYYVENGAVNFKANRVFKYYGTFYVIRGGVVIF